MIRVLYHFIGPPHRRGRDAGLRDCDSYVTCQEIFSATHSGHAGWTKKRPSSRTEKPLAAVGPHTPQGSLASAGRAHRNLTIALLCNSSDTILLVLESRMLINSVYF